MENVPVSMVLLLFNPFTPSPESAKPKIDKFSKITKWVQLKNIQHHNSFPMNGHTLGFCP